MVPYFLRLTSLPIDPALLSSKTERCVEAIFCASNVHSTENVRRSFTSSAATQLNVFCVREPCEPSRSTILTAVLISVPSQCQSGQSMAGMEESRGSAPVTIRGRAGRFQSLQHERSGVNAVDYQDHEDAFGHKGGYEGAIEVSTLIFGSHPRVGDSQRRGQYEERRFTEDSVPAITETSEKLESNSSSFKLQGRTGEDNGWGAYGPTPRASNLNLTVRSVPSQSVCLQSIPSFRPTQASVRQRTNLSALPLFVWRDTGPISYRWTTCTSC